MAERPGGPRASVSPQHNRPVHPPQADSAGPGPETPCGRRAGKTGTRLRSKATARQTGTSGATCPPKPARRRRERRRAVPLERLEFALQTPSADLLPTCPVFRDPAGLLHLQEWGRLWTGEGWAAELMQKDDAGFVERLRLQTGGASVGQRPLSQQGREASPPSRPTVPRRAPEDNDAQKTVTVLNIQVQ